MDRKGLVVDASGFGDVFEGILDDYFSQADHVAKSATQKGGRECVRQLQATSPSDSGEYAQGWRSKPEPAAFGGYYVRVYNDAKPSLTHLLEFGHEKWVHGVDTGGRVPARPHIADAADRGAEAVMEAMRDG